MKAQRRTQLELELFADTVIRLASLADLEAIIQFYSFMWQTTYQGMVDAAYLSRMSTSPHVYRTFQSLLAPWRHDTRVLLLLQGEQIIGLAMGGRWRDELSDHEFENYALYIHPEYQHMGLGYRLWRARAEHMRALGATKLHTWVFEDNGRARAAYEKWGAQPAMPFRRMAQFGQHQISEVHYVFDVAEIEQKP